MYIQATKASLFDDDVTKSKIMRENNPYQIMKLGNRVRNFSHDRWCSQDRHVVYTAIWHKFQQNDLLKNILLNTGTTLIAESSVDPYWGTGLQLYDKNSLDKRFWIEGNGVISEIFEKVRHDLRQQ